jgi:hypothetical protein
MRGIMNKDNPPKVSVWRAWRQAMAAALLAGDMAQVCWLLSAAAGFPTESEGREN